MFALASLVAHANRSAGRRPPTCRCPRSWQSSSDLNDDATIASGAKPTRKAGTRAPIPPHIPRQTTQHLPEPCGCGGKETVICEDVSEVLDYVPACFRVLRHVRPRIACRSCETIRQAPAIDLPLPKVMASSALLAHLVVSRFVDHQPWHRQSVILRRQGVEIDRDVMGRWSRKLAWLMAPLGRAPGRE